MLSPSFPRIFNMKEGYIVGCFLCVQQQFNIFGH